MLTEQDIVEISSHTVTTICTEATPGYPDPLIYVVEVPVNASPDEIKEMVIQERIDELGIEFEKEVREGLNICLAFKGDVDQRDYVFDHRI
ncbi:hypothetical protein N9Y00_06940 [Tateyamaria sp.]|nr:hypothetical protein [Tateyamaria sp.]